MKAVLDGAPQSAAGADRGEAGSTRSPRRCPECLALVRSAQPNKLFCSQQHKRAYNNRWLTRGAVLAPLMAAARITRGGSRGNTAVGARARGDAERLLQKWKDEDANAKPPRMSAVDYVAIRYQLGLVEIW